MCIHMVLRKDVDLLHAIESKEFYSVYGISKYFVTCESCLRAGRLAAKFDGNKLIHRIQYL